MAQHQNLEWVLLAGLECSDNAIASWPPMLNLGAVHVSRNRQASEWMRRLCDLRLPKLVELSVEDTVVNDSDLEAFLKAYDPVFLHLAGVKTITDEAINTLAREPRLRRITTGDSGITPDGVKRLRVGLPNVMVYDNRYE